MKKFLAILLLVVLAGCSRGSEEAGYPVYLSTMTHMEGGWVMAATDEDFFDLQAGKLRRGMDIAERYGAVLTIESEIPFAQGSLKFGDNVLAEALERGHGVGTHCDISPQERFSVAEMVEQARLRKQLVDQLVGAENNLGCSGAGGYGDWYEGLVGAGFAYVNGLVGFHYLALSPAERPVGWDNRAILKEWFHYPAPQDESYYYPFLISELGFEEDVNGDLLVSAGSIGNIETLAEAEVVGEYDTDCGRECEFNEADAKAAEDFVRDFVAQHDGSRPGKIVVYLPTSVMDAEDEDALEAFFATMEELVEEGLVQWASQVEVYEAMVEYYEGY